MKRFFRPVKKIERSKNEHGSAKMEAAWWPGGGQECPKGTKMEICDAPRIDFSLGKSNGCERGKSTAPNTVKPMVP